MIYVYSISPIDFWPGWMTEAEYLARPGDWMELDTEEDVKARHEADYREIMADATALARKVGWAGDMREGPYVAGLPPIEPGCDGQIMIAWKQDNNGQTFVVSPYPLPWLERDWNDWTAG